MIQNMFTILKVLFGPVPLGMKEVGKNQDGGKRRIVLVHGLHGDADTWLNMPEFVLQEIPGLSVCHYGYASGFKRYMSHAAKMPADDAAVLADHLRDDDYDGTYLLCGHSEGGIIIGLALRTLHQRGDSVLSQVSGQFLFNSPMAGSVWANPFGWMPFLRKDLDVLKVGSPDLTELSRYFLRHFDFNEEKQFNDKCHVPTWAMCATGDSFVSRFSSGFGVPESQITTVHGSHFSIVKPKNDKDRSLQHFLKISKKLFGCGRESGNCSEPITRGNTRANPHDINTTSGVEKLVKDCIEAHSIGDYTYYYDALKKYSLSLKKRGLHNQLCSICEVDILKRSPDSLYPLITYSQCKLVIGELGSAFNALDRILLRDPKLEAWPPYVRLDLIRTYCEILNAGGAFDISVGLLEAFLSSRLVDKVYFKNLSHTIGVLGRSYLGKGDVDLALDLFHANLAEQSLTADDHGIAIAEMNLGIANIRNNDPISAKGLFENAMEKFEGRDVRAFQWAKLNLAIASKQLDSNFDMEPVMLSSLEYYSSHSESSQQYLDHLIFLSTMPNTRNTVLSLLHDEHERVSKTIYEHTLSEDNLTTSRQLGDIYALYLGSQNATPVGERTVTRGGFKARTVLVKSFKASLDTERAVKYLDKIKKKPNHFAVPFYNDFLVEVCRRRRDLISVNIISELDRIMDQSDSIKLFFAKFLEAEHLFKECKLLLDNMQDKTTYEYLSILGNYQSYRNLNDCLLTYKAALGSTNIDHFKAVTYNNMAHAIHRHRSRVNYDMAISCCEKSISLRLSVNFWFPAVLMLALKIELANVGSLNDLVEQHRREYGLNNYNTTAIPAVNITT